MIKEDDNVASGPSEALAARLRSNALATAWAVMRFSQVRPKAAEWHLAPMIAAYGLVSQTEATILH
jgi:hypothetical protein